MLWIAFLALLFVVIESAQTPISNWEAVDMSADGKYMTAVVYGGGIYISTDYGGNWTQSLFVNSRWFSVKLSSTGQYQLVTTTSSAQCATSFDYGQTWAVDYSCSSQTMSFGFQAAMDATGKYRGVAMHTEDNKQDYFYLSSTFGNVWTRFSASATNFYPYAFGISGDGQYQMVGNYYGTIYYSTNFGSSFSSSTYTTGGGWTCIAISYNASVAIATSFDSDGAGTGGLYLSTDRGISWYRQRTGSFVDVAGDYSGRYWAATDTFFLYLSTNFGATWTISTSIPPTSSFVYEGVSISRSGGQVIAAAGYGKCIYVSRNRGQTWSECVDTRPPTMAPTSSSQVTGPPTVAPSGPTQSPTIAPTSNSANAPTFRPTTYAPSSNSSKSDGSGGIGIGTVSSLSFSSLSTTNQIAIAVVLVLVICCCCIPACYFIYRRRYRPAVKTTGRRKKGKKGGQNDDDDDDESVERMVVGNGKVELPPVSSGVTNGPKTGKEGLSKAMAKKKRKKNIAPPRKKKNRHRNEDDDDDDDDDANDEGEGDGDRDGNDEENQNQQDEGEKTPLKPNRSPVRPRPDGPPPSEGASTKNQSSGGFLSSFTSSKRNTSAPAATKSAKSGKKGNEEERLMPPDENA